MKVSVEDQCVAPRPLAYQPEREAEFAPSIDSRGIILPVPLWRFSPFRAPAWFDVNLCTDSVLPESIDPVRLRNAWVLWPLLSHIPLNNHLRNTEWGRSLPSNVTQFLQS